MNKLKSNLNEVKDIMVENIDKILEREQKVEILVKKTATMNQLFIDMPCAVSFVPARNNDKTRCDFDISYVGTTLPLPYIDIYGFDTLN